VIQPTCPPVNDNLMELLILMDALRRASAGRITAVIPYYGYARADRKPAPRVAITAKLVANLITEAGANRVITIDLHAAQIQGFFDIPLDHLYGRPVVLDYVKGRNFENTVVVSPDVGSVERARSFAKRLDMGLVIIDKRRPRPNEAMVYNIIGDVKGKTCFIFDDLVDTAGTLAMVAQSIKDQGAAKVIAAATHGVLSRDAVDRIDRSPIEELILTDTIPVNASKSAKIKVVSVAALLAEAIKRNHMGESISELFK
jgi:ribose-phosphate pyrophosphokinase